jgi:hypothetical protein
VSLELLRRILDGKRSRTVYRILLHTSLKCLVESRDSLVLYVCVMYVPYCRIYERELFQGRLQDSLVVKDKNQIEDLSSHPLRYLALLT